MLTPTKSITGKMENIEIEILDRLTIAF